MVAWGARCDPLKRRGVGPALVVDVAQRRAWFARIDTRRIELMRLPAGQSIQHDARP